MTDEMIPCLLGKDTGNGCACKVRCTPADPSRDAPAERAAIVAYLRSITNDSEARSYAAFFAREIEEGRHDAK